jgi:hypothetical protein
MSLFPWKSFSSPIHTRIYLSNDSTEVVAYLQKYLSYHGSCNKLALYQLVEHSNVECKYDLGTSVYRISWNLVGIEIFLWCAKSSLERLDTWHSTNSHGRFQCGPFIQKRWCNHTHILLVDLVVCKYW